MKSKYFNILVLTLLLFNLSLIIHYYNLKTIYHVDEMFSYGHANSSTGAYLVKGIDANFNVEDIEKHLLNRWFDGSVFHNYLTVQPEERFKYSYIFENLAVGVHPPLFYILLHTICSFTPDIFSKWQGAVLNIPIWIALLIMLYKLSSRFFKDKYLALLPVVFYAYSQIGFNTVLYIRGYLLQTLWAVCLLYEAVILLQEKQVSPKHWFLIFLYSLLGMLTQYNSIVYSAIIGVVIGFGLLFQKRYKDIMLLALILIWSLGTFLAIFPEAIGTFMHAERAQTFAEHGRNIIASIKNILYLNSTKHLSDIYMTALWSFHKTYGFVLLEIIILVLFYKYIYTKSRKDVDLLALIYISMCIYVEIFMPQMHLYNMRYIMLVMPIIAIATIWYLVFILNNLMIKDIYIKLILCFILFLNAILVDFSQQSSFAFQEDASLHNIAKNKRVIWVGSQYKSTIYEGAYILQETSKILLTYAISNTDNCANTENIVVQELDNSDYLFNHNSFELYKGGNSSRPQHIEQINEKVKEQIDYIKNIKVSERFYDIYKVKKHDHKLQGKTQ